MPSNRALQTVRGPTAPSQLIIATETDDQTNTQPQDEGAGSQPGAGRMTAQCAIRPLLSPRSKCSICIRNFRTTFQTGTGRTCTGRKGNVALLR